MLFWIGLGCLGQQTPLERVEVVSDDSDGDGVNDSDDCAPQDSSLWEDRSWEGLLEVSDLEAACPGACSLVAQDIELDEPSDLLGLHCLTAVSGDVRVIGLQAQDLAGLERLEEVGGTLAFEFGALRSLEGLDALRSVSNLRFTQLELDSLQGMPELRSVQNLDLSQGAGLQDLQGLEQLEVLRDLRVGGNMSSLAGLPALPIRKLYVTGGDFVSLDGINAQDLDALHIVGARQLQRLDFEIPEEMDRIWLQETALPDLQAFSTLKHLDGQLWIEANPSLGSLRGLDALSYANQLVLRENPELFDAQGLEALVEVGDVLHLYSQDKMGDLYGLDNLEVVGGAVIVEFNETLLDLSGLYGIREIGGSLNVLYNPQITPEEAAALVQAIGEDNVAGTITVRGY